MLGILLKNSVFLEKEPWNKKAHHVLGAAPSQAEGTG